MALALAACSAETPSQIGEQALSGEAMSPDAAAKDGSSPVQVSMPKLAYAYALNFILPGDKLADTQDAHRDLCERMGPARCQLLGFQRGGGQDQTGDALLRLRVASSEASRFSDRLTDSVTAAGGRATGTKVDAEDVSKSIVDTEARIAQREVLVKRLIEMLRARRGKVSDLVEAERSVTAAQEELDQGKAWLAELRGRVAMSTFDIHYAAAAPAADAESVAGQLGEATQASAATFLIGVRMLFTLAIYLRPWALLAFPLAMGVRWLRRKAAAVAAQP
jgi:hypothetical protein